MRSKTMPQKIGTAYISLKTRSQGNARTDDQVAHKCPCIRPQYKPVLTCTQCGLWCPTCRIRVSTDAYMLCKLDRHTNAAGIANAMNVM